MRRVMVTIAFGMSLLATRLAAQTRAQADSANSLRRCGVARQVGEVPGAYAVRCAEHFIAQQGYTDSRSLTDTSLIVPEGIEWEDPKQAWLKGRHGTLERRAAGVCGVEAGFPFTVVFRSVDGEWARAVTLDSQFGSLRVQHQGFHLEAVTREKYGCRRVSTVNAPPPSRLRPNER